MIETWKDIPGYNGKYQADCEGNVRRIYKNGKTKMLTPYLKNQRKRTIYVVMLTIDGKSKEEIMLGLMARTFLGPAPKGHVPYHINGCKSEHNIQNIAYISKKELGKRTGARARRQAVAKIDSNGEIVDVYSSAREAAQMLIDNQPTVEAVPVVHGEWFFTEYEYFTCSCCGGSYYNGSDSTAQSKSYLDNGQYYKFCPHCGAHMRKKV